LNPRHVRLVFSGDVGDRFLVGGRELDAEPLEKTPRRGRAETADDEIAFDPRLGPILGPKDGRVGFESVRRGVAQIRDLSRLELRFDSRFVEWFGTIDLFAPIDDRDVVAVLLECDGVLDARVTDAHDDDALVLVGFGVVELIGHPRLFIPGHAEFSLVALDPDGEHDMGGVDRTSSILVTDVQFEGALLAFDLQDLAALYDLGACLANRRPPPIEDLLANRLLKGHLEIGL
jgi:hypothetical protein